MKTLFSFVFGIALGQLSSCEMQWRYQALAKKMDLCDTEILRTQTQLEQDRADYFRECTK